jgi:DNA-binding NtrC family response regulator
MDAKRINTSDIWVLVVDDDLDVRSFFSNYLSRQGFKVDSVSNGLDAISFLGSNTPDAVLLDMRLPDTDGLEVLRQAKELRPNITVIMMTGFATVDSSVEAMKLGAWNYHVKPIEDPSEISNEIITAAASKIRMPAVKVEKPQGYRTTAPFPVGDTDAMKDVIKLANRAAAVDSSVLVCGESGTGKELVARLIHENCPRKMGKFLPLNCGAVADSLLESTLFGHERGAFTGAFRRTKGYFEAADGGTLFLDEIADTSLPLQAKLLRALEQRSFQRVGGVDTILTDVRIIAATNKTLDEEVSSGRFREDLLYRINVLNITIPPLRERASDVPLLVTHFLKKHGPRMGRTTQGFTEHAMETLKRYSWPGNVRELENVVERALAFNDDGDLLGIKSLPHHLGGSGDGQIFTSSGARTLAQARNEFEAQYIFNVLRNTNGNVSAAARVAGIARQNLYAKIRKHGIKARQDKT